MLEARVRFCQGYLSLLHFSAKLGQAVKVIWVIAGTVLASLVLGFWVSRWLYSDSPPQPQPQPELELLTPPSAPPSSPAPSFGDKGSPRPNPRWLRLHPERVTADTVSTNWQDEINDILSSDENNDLKARAMLRLLPALPTEGQVEVVQEADGLLPDSDYDALAEYTVNPSLPEPVLEALLAGLLDRPDSIRLPLLFNIAGDDQHPESEQAGELLQMLLEETYGTNWDWGDASAAQWLDGSSPGQNQDMTPTVPDQ